MATILHAISARPSYLYFPSLISITISTVPPATGMVSAYVDANLFSCCRQPTLTRDPLVSVEPAGPLSDRRLRIARLKSEMHPPVASETACLPADEYVSLIVLRDC